jgi:ABC-type branched-subunit amino acid transport system ATPase component
MSRDAKRSRVSDIAHAVGISELLGMPASILPYGTRRLAEVGRALVGDPRVLILDEPAAGLSTTEKGKLAALLAEVARSGTAVLLIDHDMQFVMRSCPRLVVMDAGSVIATGTPTEIQRDRVVLESYLGSGAVDGVA